jgi:hypothetical protein
MFTLKKILIVLLTVVAITASLAGDKEKSEIQQRFQRLLAIVQDAIQGKNLDQLKKKITDDAYFVDGAFFSSFHEVLSDEKLSSRLNEGDARHVAFVHANIQDDGNSGYLFLKTESEEKTEPRFYTLNFVKSKDGEFCVKDWHASH